MRIAYADPPYIGQAKDRYEDHPDYAGEVDHRELAVTLATQYDGFVLHLSAPTLYEIETYLKEAGVTDYRVMQWVKAFAAFKRNVSVAYAYEPVIVRAARKPIVRKGLGIVYRDWINEPITLKKGLTGVKPEKVCRWAFALVGAEPDDVLDDMYPGTGAVTRAWEGFRADLLNLPVAAGEAAHRAIAAEVLGGEINYGLPGGSIFDRKVAKLNA